jgi:hypothetical protein
VPPQVPQFVKLVSWVSHPLVTNPSQLPYNALHEIVQPPSVQPAVPPAEEQTLPQVPQLFTFVLVLISQPLLTAPSQLANPELQVIPHTPEAHEAEPPAVEHALPQVPQLARLVLVLVSQPLEMLPSQLPQPALHAMPHTPSVQLAEPLAVEHTMPQPPQFVRLVFVFVSQPFAVLPSQSTMPPVHEAQVPFTQPVGHATPQPPQFVLLVRMFVSQPFAAEPSQLPHPARHVFTWQVPVVQVPVAWAGAQAAPHPPQFVFVFSDASHPLVTFPSQLPKNALHVIPHAPKVQVAVPLTDEQTWPQLPQLLGLVLVLISHPVASRPSQSEKPDRHAPKLHLAAEQVPVALA